MNIERELASLRSPAPEGVSSGALLGVGLIDGYDVFDSPLGAVVVAFNTRGVSFVDLADEDAEQRFVDRFDRGLVPARPPRGWDQKIHRAIELGTPGDLPVDLRYVTAFQRRTLEAAADIPKGQARPYSWIARQVGNPRAARAVGTTMARNPIPLIVPCHRVIRSDGKIGRYSLGGPDNKRELLRHEGLDTRLLVELARRGTRFVGSATTYVFCHPTCSAARRIATDNRVEFRSAEAARTQGFRACQLCRPSVA